MKLKLKLPLGFAAILLLPSAAALHDIYSLNQAGRIYAGVLKRRSDGDHTAAFISSQFKTQAQEWTNTLLRGKDPKSPDKYWPAFMPSSCQAQWAAS